MPGGWGGGVGRRRGRALAPRDLAAVLALALGLEIAWRDTARLRRDYGEARQGHGHRAGGWGRGWGLGG